MGENFLKSFEKTTSCLSFFEKTKPKGRFFWFIFGLFFCQPLLIRNQKNRPFGLPALFISPLKPIAPV